MATSLAVQGYKDIISSLDDLLELGKVLVKSGMLPQSVRSPESAVAIILKGREIGMPIMESFALINVIQGKPTIAPQGMLALIKRSGLQEDIQIGDDGNSCTVTMRRKGESPHTVSFSMDDAKAMGLAGKDNWVKQPKVMRQWRAIAACARVVFPDIIGGMYLPEEMGVAVNDDGEIVGRDTTGWTVDSVIANLPKEEDEQKHATVDVESAQVAPTQESSTEQKVPPPVEAQPTVEMIDIGDGKTKPRHEKIGTKVANSEWFKTHILGHKHFLDKSNNPVRKHFDNHLMAHFGLNSPVNITWEMFVALRNHLDSRGDDPKYYKPDAKEEVKKDVAKTLVERIGEVGLLPLVAQWHTDYGQTNGAESPEFLENIENVLEGIKNSYFDADSKDGLREIDETFRLAMKEVPF